jgi:hypothetical protein
MSLCIADYSPCSAAILENFNRYGYKNNNPMEQTFQLMRENHASGSGEDDSEWQCT